MRVRCTRGITPHTFHGNFFVRSTDLLSLPNINPDAGFAMQVPLEISRSVVLSWPRLLSHDEVSLVSLKCPCEGVHRRRPEGLARSGLPSGVALHLVQRRAPHPRAHLLPPHHCLRHRRHQLGRPAGHRGNAREIWWDRTDPLTRVWRNVLMSAICSCSF